jgi:hypothetical protein
MELALKKVYGFEDFDVDVKELRFNGLEFILCYSFSSFS